MLLSNQQKYILEILKEFKYLRVRQLHAMVRTHYRAQGIEIDARRMEIMLRQMRTGTNYVWLRGDVVSYGDRRIDPRLLEALDVMLELTKAQPGFYSKDGLHEPFLLRFTGNGKGAGYLFSVAWLDAANGAALRSGKAPDVRQDHEQVVRSSTWFNIIPKRGPLPIQLCVGRGPFSFSPVRFSDTYAAHLRAGGIWQLDACRGQHMGKNE